MKRLMLALIVCLLSFSGRASSIDSVPMVRKVYVVPDSVALRYLEELDCCYSSVMKKSPESFARCWMLVGLKMIQRVPTYWYFRPLYIW